MASTHRMPYEQRRAAIIAAAIRLFAERGFRGTTTRELAASVGVTEPVLYQHFKSKRELFRAIIEHKSREGLEQGSALLKPYCEARDDRGFFTTLAEFMTRRYQQDAAYARLLMFIALEHADLAQLFHERQILELHQRVARYIKGRVEQGAFRAVDPALAARAFLSMVVHHNMLRVLFRDNFVKGSDKGIIRGIVDIYLRGITAEGKEK